MIRPFVAGVVVLLGLFLAAPAAAEPVTFKFAAAGDFGSGQRFRGTLKTVAAQNTDFMIGLGDFSYGKISEQEWCDVVKQYLGDQYSFQLIAGNHDIGEDPDEPGGDINLYAKCLPNRMTQNYGGRYAEQYYFDYNKMLRVILISPGQKINGRQYLYRYGSNNWRWLNERIVDGKRKGYWTVVAMHKNCLTIGSKNCEIGRDLFNYLTHHNIDLILQGHDHIYAKTKTIGDSKYCSEILTYQYNQHCVSKPGTVVVINGTGGALLYNISSRPISRYFDSRSWHGRNVRPAYGPLVVEVTPKTMTLQYTPNDGSTPDISTITR